MYEYDLYFNYSNYMGFGFDRVVKFGFRTYNIQSTMPYNLVSYIKVGI